jgi:GNAT superfamily N-acetyltransferase
MEEIEEITEYNLIVNATDMIKSYREGFLTNFFMGEARCNLLIKNKLFYSIKYNKCIFIFYRDHDFYHLYFMATNEENLKESLGNLRQKYQKDIFVTDIIGSENSIQKLAEVFQQIGFKKYILLYRMSRVKTIDETQTLDSKVEYAVPDYSEQIYSLLEKYFDKYSEQIPLGTEIVQWVASNNILVLTEGKKITGFVIFEKIGVTAYLRYWFTHPDYRNKKIGSALLKRFFYECRDSKRQLFWVISTNENAIIRYKHYGFVAEKLFDQVLISFL